MGNWDLGTRGVALALKAHVFSTSVRSCHPLTLVLDCHHFFSRSWFSRQEAHFAITR